MEIKHNDKLNTYCSVYRNPLDIVDDGNLRSDLIDLLQSISHTQQLYLFDSPRNQVTEDLNKLRRSGCSLYMRFTKTIKNKKRSLSVPTKPLSEFISRYIIPLITKTPQHASCHGGEALWSPQKTLESHLPITTVLSFDLSNAFSNVSIGNIFDFYYAHFLEYPETQRIAFAGFLSFLSSSWVNSHRVLPQGASHSPKLFNRILYKMDEKLHTACVSKGFHYTRWIDDFTISSPQEKTAESFLGAVELIGEQMTIAKNKIFFQDKKSDIYLLGHVINNGRIFKNHPEERNKYKAKPLDYDYWFNAQGRYEKW